MRDDGGASSEDQLERLARYFDEEVIAAKTTNTPEIPFCALLTKDAVRA